MSSTSSYEPDDDESDFDSDTAPGRARQRQSTSRSQSVNDVPAGLEGDHLVGNPVQIDQGRIEASKKLSRDIQPNFLEAYTKLLAEVEKDHDPKNVEEDDDLLNVTQDGAVVWTATEKEVLYNVLDRKSLNGIKEIAAAIGTKSELEVMEHLRVVQKTIKDHLYQRRLKYVTVAEIPAAVEISEACCAEEEKYARQLSLIDEIQQAKFDGRVYGEYGRIGETEAQALGDADIDSRLQGDLQLAVGLFNMPMWLYLSTNYLMNFGGSREEDNWRNVAQSEEETPSIAAEAIMDFSALTMSLTRRLVESALFMAESRLRMNSHVATYARIVSSEDVRSAIDVLGLKRKRIPWVDLARRNQISIGAFRPQRLNPCRILSYKKAEEILNYNDRGFYKTMHAIEREKTSHRSGNENSAVESDDSGEDLMDEDEDLYEGGDEGEDAEGEDEESDEEDADRDTSSRDSELLDSGITDFQLAEDQEEEEADKVDRERSRQEELRLWSLFNKVPPPSLLVPVLDHIPRPEDLKREVTDDEKDHLAHHGFSERRNFEDLVDWRNNILYRSEWEQYGSDMEDLAEELGENTRKRRRIEAGDLEPHSDGERDDHKMPLSAEIVESDDDVDENPSEYDKRSDNSHHSRGHHDTLKGASRESDASSEPDSTSDVPNDHHNSKSGAKKRDASDEISSDSGSGSDSNPDSSDSPGSPADQLPNDSMDIDDEVPVALPPNDFM